MLAVFDQVNVGILDGSLCLISIATDGPTACWSQQLTFKFINRIIISVVRLKGFVLSESDVFNIVDLFYFIFHFFNKIVKFHDALDKLWPMARVVCLMIGHHLLFELITFIDDWFSSRHKLLLRLFASSFALHPFVRYLFIKRVSSLVIKNQLYIIGFDRLLDLSLFWALLLVEQLRLQLTCIIFDTSKFVFDAVFNFFHYWLFWSILL